MCNAQAGDCQPLKNLPNVRTAGRLYPEQVGKIADFAEYLRSREKWEVTLELMNDPAMREDVEEGRAQAACGFLTLLPNLTVQYLRVVLKYFSTDWTDRGE